MFTTEANWSQSLCNVNSSVLLWGLCVLWLAWISLDHGVTSWGAHLQQLMCIVSDLLSFFFEKTAWITLHYTCALCILPKHFVASPSWKASLWLLTGFTGLLSAETRFSRWKCGNWFKKTHPFLIPISMAHEARTSWPAPSVSLQPIGFDGARPSTSVPLGSEKGHNTFVTSIH